MDIIDIYRSILKFSGSEADDQGYVSSVVDDDRQPILVDGLRLVLPTSDQLRHFNTKEKIIFHPLAENILKDESNVIKKFRDIINIRLNYTTGVIAQSLLRLVASSEFHKRLTPEQTELLLAVKEADSKTVVEFLQHMASSMKTKPDRIFVNIFLKKGGKKHNEKYARLGVVSFPFYEAIPELKFRQKDRQAFKQLFEFMFINIDKKHEYDYGSNSRVAPYLDALLQSAVGVASRLNDILELYGDFIENSEQLKFHSDWYEYFSNLEELLPEIRKIPAHVSQDNVVAPVAQMPELIQPIPGLMPAPGAPLMPAVQQPMVQPAQTGVVKTERGLDFRSVLQNNPALAYAPNPLAGAIQAQQFQSGQLAYDAYGRPVQVMPQQQPVPMPGYQQPAPVQMPVYQQAMPGYQQQPVPMPGYQQQPQLYDAYGRPLAYR